MQCVHQTESSPTAAFTPPSIVMSSGLRGQAPGKSSLNCHLPTYKSPTQDSASVIKLSGTRHDEVAITALGTTKAKREEKPHSLLGPRQKESKASQGSTNAEVFTRRHMRDMQKLTNFLDEPEPVGPFDLGRGFSLSSTSEERPVGARRGPSPTALGSSPEV